jgi:4-hydroxy 2-oxovalerate aldolase
MISWQDKMIKLLDCTLRDGGYVNEWNFGENAICDIKRSIEKSGIEIIEVGFLKDVRYNPNKTLFPGVEWAEHIIFPKSKEIIYCLMVDAPVPFPIDRISERYKAGIDAIRIIVWKELIKECVEYSKILIEKGYQVFIQPARVNQYSAVEFVNLIEAFNPIGITAFYIVDSWGTQDSVNVLGYAQQAELYLNNEISLGYHGHNHKQQALSCAEKVLSLNKNLILDCSIFGMGRDAGNLNTELIITHLNKRYNMKYDIKPILKSYSINIQKYYDEFGWGYSMEHFMTAIFNCNTKYITYIMNKTSLSMDVVYEIFERMTTKQRIEYSEELIKELINDTRP